MYIQVPINTAQTQQLSDKWYQVYDIWLMKMPR